MFLETQKNPVPSAPEAPVAAAIEAGYKVASAVHANGAPVDHGWTWLYEEGHFAEWTFGPIAITHLPDRELKAALNFELRSTTGFGGGAGFGTRVRLRVYDSHGLLFADEEIEVANPFRPALRLDTHGAGYQAHAVLTLGGHIIERLGHGLRVRLEWPTLDGHRIAVAEDSTKAIFGWTY